MKTMIKTMMNLHAWIMNTIFSEESDSLKELMEKCSDLKQYVQSERFDKLKFLTWMFDSLQCSEETREQILVEAFKGDADTTVYIYPEEYSLSVCLSNPDSRLLLDAKEVRENSKVCLLSEVTANELTRSRDFIQSFANKEGERFYLNALVCTEDELIEVENIQEETRVGMTPEKEAQLDAKIESYFSEEDENTPEDTDINLDKQKAA